jgi:hypothetical protein
MYTSNSQWGTSENHRKMIRTRVRMSDGSIIQGQQGQKIIDDRRWQRDKAIKEAKR